MERKLAYKQITRIENDLTSLKNLLSQKKVVSLRGLLKGIKITEEGLDEAMKSIFKVNGSE